MSDEFSELSDEELEKRLLEAKPRDNRSKEYLLNLQAGKIQAMSIQAAQIGNRFSQLANQQVSPWMSSRLQNAQLDPDYSVTVDTVPTAKQEPLTWSDLPTLLLKLLKGCRTYLLNLGKPKGNQQ
jgi:hypothetical protein